MFGHKPLSRGELEWQASTDCLYKVLGRYIVCVIGCRKTGLLRKQFDIEVQTLIWVSIRRAGSDVDN